MMSQQAKPRRSRPIVESLEGRELLSHAAVAAPVRESIVHIDAVRTGFRAIPFRGNVTYQVSITGTSDPSIVNVSYLGRGSASPLGPFSTSASYNIPLSVLQSYSSGRATVPNVPFEVDFDNGAVVDGVETISTSPTRRGLLNVRVNGLITSASESLAGATGNFGAQGRFDLSTGLLNASINGRFITSTLPR
jgi:hypothetical protein